MLPEKVLAGLANKELMDFGIAITSKGFNFHTNYCELPTSLVIAYSLAIASSGLAKQIIIVGFDGYGIDDLRSKEMGQVFKDYLATPNAVPLTSITPTQYEISVKSIFGLNL